MNNQGGMSGYGSGGSGGTPGQPGQPGQPPAQPSQPGQPQYIPAGQQPQPQYYQGGYGGTGGAAQAGIAPTNPMGYANSPQQQYPTSRASTGTAAASSGGGYGNYYGGQPAPGGTQGYIPQQPQQPNMYGMQPQMPTSGSSMYGSGSIASSAPPPNTNFGMTPAYSSSTVTSVPFGTIAGLPGSGIVPVSSAPLPPFVPAPQLATSSGILLQSQPVPTAPVQLQPMQPQPAAAPAVAPPAAAAATATQPSLAQPQPQQTTVATKIPNPYSADVLNKLEKCSVPDLCNIGRELIADLTYRTSTLCTTFKAVSDRKPYNLAIEPQLEYCHMILEKIVEIRIRIEQDMPKKELTTEDFIEMMREPGEPFMSQRVTRYEGILKMNRNKLIHLSTDLKMLDWLAQVADPSHLKKTDGMPRKESSKPGVI